MNVRLNMIWYTVPRLLSGSVNLILLPIYTRMLPPSDFGIAMVVVAVASLSNLVVAPGIETAYMRWAHQRPGVAGLHGTGAGTLTLLHLGMLGLGVAALLLGTRVISATMLPGIPVWPYYYAIVATVFLTSLQAPLRAAWRADHHASKVAKLEIARATVSAATILIALVVAGLGPISIMLGELAAGIVLLPLCIRPILTALPEGWDQRAFAAIAPVALVGVPLSASGYVLATLDRIVLLRTWGPEVVGIYAVAFQVGALILAVTITMNKEWQPLIFRLAAGAADDHETLQRLWARSLCLVLLVGSIVSCFSVEIVRWWLGPHYEASAAVVPWIVLMCMLRIARTFLTNLSLARGRAADLTVDSVMSIVVFAGSLVLLVPRFGAQGAAWAGVVTYGTGAVFLFTRPWNAYALDRRLTAAIGVILGALLLGWMMGGGVVTRVVGGMLSVLVIFDMAAYWRFLGSLPSVRAES